MFNGYPSQDKQAPSYEWKIDEQTLDVVRQGFQEGIQLDRVEDMVVAHLRERGAPASAVGDYCRQAETSFMDLLFESKEGSI